MEHPVVALGLKVAVDEEAGDGQHETGQVESRERAHARMQAPLRQADLHPSGHGDADGDAEEDDEADVAEAVVQVDGEAGEHAHEEREHLPRPHDRRHGQNGDHKGRVRADEVGQLQAVVVEYAERVELLVARVIELSGETKRSQDTLQIYIYIHNVVVVYKKCTHCGEEHVVEVDERLDVPASIQRQAYGQQEDEIAGGEHQDADKVGPRRYGVPRVCATVSLIACNMHSCNTYSLNNYTLHTYI